MSSAPSLINGDKEHPESKPLSIEIEPSPLIILAIAQLFRAYKQPTQAIELCRLGLNYFPGDMGLRLGTAMAHLDLKENDKAWTEIKAVAQELNQLAPTLGIIAKHAEQFGKDDLSEWFIIVSQVLANYPEASPEAKADFQVPNGVISLSPPEAKKDEMDQKREILPDSNVMSTLNNWLSKLKENKT